ncbi:MAG: DUF86 domain-containing protein [bacterium]|nr:DUF86 domain-containing protein [bacterium]
MTSDSPYIALMLDCISKIRSFTTDVSYDAFAHNQEKQSAVLMQLLLIGELSRRVSEDTKRNIAIPWSEIAGMRNRVVHEYHDIDLNNVWKIVTEDLATTEAPLAVYLRDHPLPKEEV